MKCKRCGEIVYQSNEVVEVSNGYSYYCNECDEDLFTFEVENASIDELLTALIKIVRADENWQTICECHCENADIFEQFCRKLNLKAEDNADAVTETSKMIDNICKYIKEMI